MSTIAYTPTAPASVAPAAARFLAGREAQWCDYAACGAAPRFRATPACLVPLEGWADTVAGLKAHHGFDLLVDHTAVDYPDRAPRFLKALERMGAKGAMADLDDGPEQAPLEEGVVRSTLLSLLPPGEWDLILTHGPKGEYTRHLRHEEVSRAVLRL